MAKAVQSIIPVLKRGSVLLLADDAGPEKRFYLICSAHDVTADRISFMVNHGRGVICAGVSEARIKELGLPPMSTRKQSAGVEFTVSVEARSGVTTGISAADRAVTLQTLANSRDARFDLVTPGHIFPMRAVSGGVLVRSDIAEAAVDLMTLAGLPPVAAICQCLDQNGDFLREDAAAALAHEQKISTIKVTDVIRYRLASETIVEKIAEASLPTTAAGNFHAVCFLSKTDRAEHLALVKGDLNEMDETGKQRPLLVRVQAEHRMGDLLGLDDSLGLSRIRDALKAIDERGRGVFVYVRHPRKGILADQIRQLSLGKPPMTAARELREYGIGAQILRALNVTRIELLTNSTTEITGVEAFNLEIVGRSAFQRSSDQEAAR
ncbi:MAG: 3,4-dihydroxy-2-butanone-4-phosphate synthase [Bdellovibrionota bacterium]